MAEPLRYRAFLSYSHLDKAWGDWLHSALERYQIPHDLRGKPSKFGQVPQSLRPIFRDRDDLEAGHSLHEQVEAALVASEALIVMCSPDSAKSTYVNEEIRRFKALGRSDRIYPIIVRGEPGSKEQECFPEALRRKVDASGQLTDVREEPLAADARDQGDGRELAQLKLIAGLLDLDLDELRKREAIEAKRRQRRTQFIAGAMALLAIVASGSAVYALNQRNAAVEARQLAQIERDRAEQQRDEAKKQRDEADRQRKAAEHRYSQALESTLRLVTTSATLRSLMDKTPFAVSQIQSKGESDDFLEFLQSAKDPNAIWLRLVQVLLRYENNAPPELRRYRAQLVQAGMPLQWVKHGEVIMRNIIRTGGDKPEYATQLASVHERIVALGGTAEKDCLPAAPAAAPVAHNDPVQSNANVEESAAVQMQQAPLRNMVDSPMQQQMSPQAMRSPPPC